VYVEEVPKPPSRAAVGVHRPGECRVPSGMGAGGRAPIDRTSILADVADAHRRLESGEAVGKIVLAA